MNARDLVMMTATSRKGLLKYAQEIEQYLTSEYRTELQYFVDYCFIEGPMIVAAFDREQEAKEFVDDHMEDLQAKTRRWYVTSLLSKPLENAYGYSDEDRYDYEDTDDNSVLGYR